MATLPNTTGHFDLVNRLNNGGLPAISLTQSDVDKAKLIQKTKPATPQDFGAVGDGNPHPLSEKYATLSLAKIDFPFVTSLSQTIDWAARQKAIFTGKRVFIPKGTYVVNEETEYTTPGQIIEYENTGGYAYGEDIGLNWQPNTRIIATNGFSRRIRTRRLYRASAADPQDAPLSVVENIQAEGVILINPCVWLECDYTNNSPTNFGAEVDVGIFVGTRVGVKIVNPQVIGYFRRSGILYDVSGGSNLPRFPDRLGVPYPTGTVLNGGDGAVLEVPYIRGSRIGLDIAGALPKVGETTYTTPYYDEILGTTVADVRGSFGFSDFLCTAGRIYGPDHHSNYRLSDPQLIGGVLSQSTMLLEPDLAPAAVRIDAMAGNASTNAWGMRFLGTRIATFEAFRVRLNKASRVTFYSCHIEGRNGGRFTSTGQTLDSNNYVTSSYGDIAATSLTDRVKFLNSVRQSPADGASPHYYGNSFTLETDSGRTYRSDYTQSLTGELDFRGAPGSGVRFRSDTDSLALIDTNGILLYGPTIQGLRSNTSELDLRSAASTPIRFRNGSTTVGLLDGTNATFTVSGSIRPTANGTVSLGDATHYFANNFSVKTTWSSGVIDTISSGTPEGIITGSPGSIARDTVNGVIYIKKTGTGNTGWKLVTQAA